jgi:hypothetical protein
MGALIQALFPEGQRKVMVNLIALAIGTVVFLVNGHQIPDNMVTMLLGLSAIFNGGNILEHLSEVLGGLKGSKAGQIIEDLIPGDQGLGAAAPAGVQMAQSPQQQHAQVAADVAGQIVSNAMDQVGKRFADLENKLTVQAQNQAKLVQFINSMTQKAQAQAPAPQE